MWRRAPRRCWSSSWFALWTAATALLVVASPVAAQQPAVTPWAPQALAPGGNASIPDVLQQINAPFGTETNAPDGRWQPSVAHGMIDTRSFQPYVPPSLEGALPATDPAAILNAEAAVKAAENDVSEPIKKDIGNQLQFFAQRSSMNQRQMVQEFEGDVVAIGGGTLISGDKVRVDRVANIAEAQGHIIILNRNQLFLGDAVTYHLATGDFEITRALMLSNDQAEIKRVSGHVFGFTPDELAFEEARKKRLAELAEELSALRREAQRKLKAANIVDTYDVPPAQAEATLGPELMNRYTQLLEEEKATKEQESPGLAPLSEDRRELLKKRRAFWEQSQKSPLGLKAGALQSLYMHIEGDTLSRVNGNDFAARNALFTPCLCELGESPAWAFRADEMTAQQGGYADLDHAVLEIKGIPILYLPHMTVPLKDKRQSGFLMPTITYDQQAGNIVNQPFYMDLGDSSDSTITTDFYEKRGTRVGVEYRVQQKEFSGWEFKVEGIRDQLWAQDRGNRNELGDMYRDGLNAASQCAPGSTDPACATPQVGAPPYLANIPLSLPAEEYTRKALTYQPYWKSLGFDPTNKSNDPKAAGYNAALQDINTYMAVPRNDWRGSSSWRGVTYLAPRLSLVSNGEVNSDHRYPEDLYVADDFNTALFGGLPAKAFTTANYQLNLDAKDYYVGLGGRYGDNYFEDDRFQGQQLPSDFRVQSRYLSLMPANSMIPVYLQLRGENINISEFRSDLGPQPLPGTAAPYTLGDGTWRRAQVSTESPLLTDHIIQVSHFADAEERMITHHGLDQSNSTIMSWHTGFEFRLPIDGEGDLPDFLQTDDCLPQAQAQAVPTLFGSSPPSAAAITPVVTSPKTTPQDCAKKGDLDAPRRFVHHFMDYRLRLSARPMVEKRGPYAMDQSATPNNATDHGQNLSYFASDVTTLRGVHPEDTDVPDEERMMLEQRITFSMDHQWHLIRRAWQNVAGSPDQPTKVEQLSPSEKARRDLLKNLARPDNGADSMYDQAHDRWLVDRYQLADQDLGTPVTFHGDIGYDFHDAKTRDLERSQNAQADAVPGSTRPNLDLTEAWKPANFQLGLNYANWAIAAAMQYNIYYHAAVTDSITLTFPTYFQTNMTLGYSVARTYQANENNYSAVAERDVDMVTSLIPPVSTFLSFHRQITDGQPNSYVTSIRTAVGFKYDPPSQCWNLKFSRLKDYGTDEINAQYVLQLSVVMMGQERGLPNMSPGVQQQSDSRRTL